MIKIEKKPSVKKAELLYNKWYIKPEIRLKKPVRTHRKVRSQDYGILFK
jgi:hypothetical protein